LEVSDERVEHARARGDENEIIAEGFLRKIEGISFAERLKIPQGKAVLDVFRRLHTDADAALSGRSRLHDDTFQKGHVVNREV
jgi:hypothetical protein